MKSIRIFAALCTLMCMGKGTFSQTELPLFLAGTWKYATDSVFEHWDVMGPDRMKGISYSIHQGRMEVIEYLDITAGPEGVYYGATVVGQNEGEEVHFDLTQADSIWVFENLFHDFPKRIEYRQISADQLHVKVTGSNFEGFEIDLVNEKAPTNNPGSADNPSYDAALAARLGGDEYGMKSYFLVILKTGSTTTEDKTMVNEAFQGHMENMDRMVADGKLVVAGPLGKNELTYRGIFILHNLNNREEVQALLQSDPAIKSGLLEPVIIQWYGSAALPEYLPFSDRIWKVKP